MNDELAAKLMKGFEELGALREAVQTLDARTLMLEHRLVRALEREAGRYAIQKIPAKGRRRAQTRLKS